MAMWVPVTQPFKLNRSIRLPIRAFELGQSMSKRKFEINYLISRTF